MDQRIGTAEREEAVKALAEHLRAGRLTSTEYEARYGSARDAATWADLDPLFIDLPEPHPRPPAAPYGSRGSYRATPKNYRGRAVVTDLGTHDGMRKLRRVIPLVAFVLVIVTHSWLWFWLIPIVFVLSSGRRSR